MTSDYIDANRANWDERATLHAARDGSGYGVQRYVDDSAALSDVVRFDLPLLGDTRASGRCTCSATSAPTLCHSLVWARE